MSNRSVDSTSVESTSVESTAAKATFGPARLGNRTGTVFSYEPDAGLGIVEDGDGQRWMFHCTTIADGSRSIEAGVAVTFEVRVGGPGRFEAFDVLPAPVR